MTKLLIITGPTATGKTALGIKLAKIFNGEIISADSRQVYKHMDIGTGKDKNLYKKAGVKVWGLDLVNPGYPFNVSEWVRYAIKVIRDIWERGRLPIIVGGTGQYIKELLSPSETLHIGPNQKLRDKLAALSRSDLQKRLQQIDPEKWSKMNASDQNNPRRLIRAIEVSGKKEKPARLLADVVIVGLTAPTKYLYPLIDRRVDQRIAAGVDLERTKLWKMGYHPNAFGYRGESTSEWKLAEHQYAHRQLTYLKKFLRGEQMKGKKVICFDISKHKGGKLADRVADRMRCWYSWPDDQKNPAAGHR